MFNKKGAFRGKVKIILLRIDEDNPIIFRHILKGANLHGFK